MNAPADLLLRLCVQAGEIVVSHEAAGSIETLLRNGFVEVEELTRGRMRVVPTQAGRHEAEDRPPPRYRSEGNLYGQERKKRHAI